MSVWIDRALFTAITLAIGVLATTASPVLLGVHLGGMRLMLHMLASGVLVSTLPLLALWYLPRSISPLKSGGLQRLGFWSLLLTGIVTITTMFLCMLPVPSTGQMEQLVAVHRYAGFAMVPAIAVLLLGSARWRRIQSTRSATPG
jgi:hypothetical protein